MHSGHPNTLQALSNYLDYLDRHGFSRVYFTGVDLLKRSMNVYFSLQENGCKTKEQVRAVLRELNFAVPNDEEVIEYMLGCGSFAMTLSWDEPECKRCCFYVLTTSQDRMPAAWSTFARDATLPHESAPDGDTGNLNSCFVSCSFGHHEQDQYLKQESDWHGDYLELLHKIESFNPRSYTLPQNDEDAE